MFKRLLAVLTTTVLALGLSIGAAAPVSANNETCNSIGYTKFDSASGSQTLPWGTLTWSGQSLTYTLGAGWTVDLCIKSGSQAGTSTYQDVSGTGTLTISQGISHIGYKDPTRVRDIPVSVSTVPSATPPSCDVDGTLVIPTQANILFTGGTHGAGPGTYTVNATAATGYVISGQSSWTITVLPKGIGQNCERSVEPTLTISECDATTGAVVSAFITIPSTTPHLTYSIGSTNYRAGQEVTLPPGSYTVTVTAASGWTNTGPASYLITIAALGCNEAVAPTLTAGVCNALTGPVSAFITIPTTTPRLIYSIGTTDYEPGTRVDLSEGDYRVDVRAQTGWTNTGPAGFDVTVERIECESVTYIAPAVVPETCDTDLGGTKQSTLAFTLDPNLAYYLDGSLVTSAAPILAAAGPHTVKVVPAVGHYLSGGVDTFIVSVPKAVGCDQLYTIPLDPFTGPETCDPFSTEGESVDGSITIVHVAGVQFSIGTQANGSDKVAAGTSATTVNVVYPRPAGDYYVFAESADPEITLKPGHDFWPLTVGVPKPACLPTQGLLVANATATNAVCTALGTSQGTIVIEPTPGVSYAFKGGAAITAASTKVAPGTYTIVATADDGLSTLSADEWVLTVAVASAVCDLTTLALTGQTPIGMVALGILLLQAGLVLMGIRLVRTRLTPRHVAA